MIRSMIASQIVASHSFPMRLYQPFGSNCVQKITEPFTLRASMISRSSRVCSVDTGLNRNSCEVIAEKDFFQDLGKVNVLELLKYLAEFQLPMLSKEAYRQIVKYAEELYPLLREITPRLHKNILSCFLTRWLENEQLLFDLNRFVRQGWISQGNFYTRTGYIQEVYRYAIKSVDRLEYYQESVLLYAVKHQKKHFLRLYEENTELFLGLPWNLDT